jgi:hypothetical protein
MNNRSEQDGTILVETWECCQCGIAFDPNTTNYKKVDNGNKVVCGDDCKNNYEQENENNKETLK